MSIRNPKNKEENTKYHSNKNYAKEYVPRKYYIVCGIAPGAWIIVLTASIGAYLQIQIDAWEIILGIILAAITGCGFIAAIKLWRR